MGHVATTGGITAENVQDLTVASVEHRYGHVNASPEPIEWLADHSTPDACTVVQQPSRLAH